MSLDATVGTTTANSYVTAEEAILYFEDRLHSSAWGDFEYQETALVTASGMLDWFITWKGIKTLDEQSMQWPRSNVTRPSGVSVDDDIIPNEVKVAVYELALVSMVEDRVAENSLAGLNQVQAGPLMIKTDGGGFDSTKKESIPDHVYKILSDLTSRGGAGVVRLMRA